jgi:hypothetical protein
VYNLNYTPTTLGWYKVEEKLCLGLLEQKYVEYHWPRQLEVCVVNRPISQYTDIPSVIQLSLRICIFAVEKFIESLCSCREGQDVFPLQRFLLTKYRISIWRQQNRGKYIEEHGIGWSGIPADPDILYYFFLFLFVLFFREALHQIIATGRTCSREGNIGSASIAISDDVLNLKFSALCSERHRQVVHTAICRPVWGTSSPILGQEIGPRDRSFETASVV